jgi:ABC-type bacteriocin/lantibiotic exporter with double-glycine peptidase domain
LKTIGKSTTLSLLLRYYEPASGQIIINGRSIEQYDIKKLRQNIGVVSQEPVSVILCSFVILQLNILIDSIWYEHL